MTISLEAQHWRQSVLYESCLAKDVYRLPRAAQIGSPQSRGIVSDRVEPPAQRLYLRNGEPIDVHGTAWTRHCEIHRDRLPAVECG